MALTIHAEFFYCCNLLEMHLGHQDINVLGLKLLLVDHQVEAEDEGEDPLVLLVKRPTHLKNEENAS